MGLSVRMPDQKKNGPGPGSYNHESSLISLNTSQVTISKSKRETFFSIISKIAKQTPGPSCYTEPATPKKILGGVIGSRLKFELIKQSSPGPAQYTPDASRSSFTKLP